MTLQDEFEAGAREFARHLEERAARERRVALSLEARDRANGAAFAEFFEARLTQTEHDTDSTNTQEN